ncbi:C2 and GRAM domain-containing protein [Sesamum angolense]|uniref:C2 and GRAM domain-containing protein n=1 Tax=Sesamum angolense TaxID=2727404 RepID=A0AAE1W4R1_9LAMI|nr:C2 and GRAM domain-containing protein [Sesamum angolense]
MANPNGSTSDLRTAFLRVYSVLKSDLLNDPAFEWTDASRQWVDRMLDYNVPGGKFNRGLSVVDSYKLLKKVGMIAVNDGIMLRNHIPRILKKHFRQKPYYVDLLDLFNEMIDLITTIEGEKDLSKYSLLHRRIVQYKTAYYSFYLPDDYLDCFGDPEKIGEEHYGKADPADVAKIKALYNDINLQGVFAEYENEDKYFNDDFVGETKVPVNWVFEAKDQSLGTAWYVLQSKNKKAKSKDGGEILLTICFSQNSTLLELPPHGDPSALLKKHSFPGRDTPSRSLHRRSSSPRLEEVLSSAEEKLHAPTFADRIAQIFNKNGDTTPMTSVEATDVSDAESVNSVDGEQKCEEQFSSVGFQELMRSLEMKDQGGELPSNLSGGVVLDKYYGTAPAELNSIIFSPESNFLKSSADIQGSTDLQIGPWKFENNGESLKRVVSSIKPPTKLVKALKATEEQTYLKADGKAFAVLASVNTPDAPYGKTFKTEILHCISPGPEQPSGEQTSRLVVSWRLNFSQSTMMKGMIENGARQGIKESFEQIEKLLAQMYFFNVPVIAAILLGLYVLTHLSLATPSTIQGLEFVGLDLPDSPSELIVCVVLVLRATAAGLSVSLYAGQSAKRKQFGKSELKTMLRSYVVFTCNGKKEPALSSFRDLNVFGMKFSNLMQWMSLIYDGCGSFDFDGPFSEATSLGRAEINFLKSNFSDLSDIWIPLQGKLGQAFESKLHLKIFLNNTKGNNVVKDYIAKMEKEVGKKIKLRSPQTNSAFQKLFGLPPEEFLINDFACNLKRRMPLQGRLFLSVRMIGFHADLFGHKTKFFFLWEDIEDIQVIPPTLSSMGSPIMVMILKPGRGFDARHGAKKQDSDGRLKFHFHSFVSFDVAQRTIMALWKARALTPEQKVQIAEEESEGNGLQTAEEESMAESIQEEVESKRHQTAEDDSDTRSLQNDDNGSFRGPEDVNMSMVYSSVLAVPTSFFMELFGGCDIDQRIAERAGCLNYTRTPWESEKPDVYQRQLRYKFDKLISRYRGEVTSTQQKSGLSGNNGWVVEEIMNLQGFMLGNYFTLHLRYQVEDLPSRSVGCSVQVYFGIEWLQHTRHQKRIRKSITSNLLKRLRVMFSELEKEYISGA